MSLRIVTAALALGALVTSVEAKGHTREGGVEAVAVVAIMPLRGLRLPPVRRA